MPRRRRTDFPGAWHHVMHRGARRQPIFHDESHCILFLGCLAEVVQHLGLEVHAYALMPNHYHLLVRSVHGNLSRCMRHLNATYTQRVNVLHRWDGPLFRGRFHSQRVDEASHLKTVIPYIHLNPVRARLVPTAERAIWSSYPAYLGKSKPPEWLTRDTVLGLYSGVANMKMQMQGLRSGAIPWPTQFDLERGVFRGWQDEPLDAVERAEKRQDRLGRVRDRVAATVGRTWDEVCTRKKGPGGNPALRFAVWALHRTTQLTQTEIGVQVGLRASHVAVLLNRLRKSPPPAELAAWQNSYLEDAPARPRPKAKGPSTNIPIELRTSRRPAGKAR